MPDFCEGLASCARDLLKTHVELSRECRYIADLQRWLLSHITTALHFEQDIDPSAPVLTPSFLFKVLRDTKIASRNTVTSFIKEMTHYGFLERIATSDKRNNAVRPTALSLHLIWLYLDIHLRALDAIDKRQRSVLLREHPEILAHMHSRFARKIIAQEAWYEPPRSIANFAGSNSGSSVLHELASFVPANLPEAGTPIWTAAASSTALAKRYGLSKSQAARLFASAKREGFIGWAREGDREACWVSPELVRDYRSWQALKLSTIARAFWEATQYLGFEEDTIES